MKSGFTASNERLYSGMLDLGLQTSETPDLKACACADSSLYRSCRNSSHHSSTASLYDEQELLERSAQALPLHAYLYPPPSAAFPDKVRQKRAMKSIALIVPKMIRRLSGAVRCTSKASSPCQTRGVAGTRSPHQNKAGKAGAVIHQHHIVHHHHVYHICPHATGGADHPALPSAPEDNGATIDVPAMHVKVGPPVRRHSSSDSHYRGLVPEIMDAPPAPHVPPRRRRFSSESPRPAAYN